MRVADKSEAKNRNSRRLNLSIMEVADKSEAKKQKFTQIKSFSRVIV